MPAAPSLLPQRKEGGIRPINALSRAFLAEDYSYPPVLAARKYVSPRRRALNTEEQETRAIAYAIKRADAAEEIAQAAEEMAALLPPNLPRLTLVPLPASSGCKQANLALSRAISAAYRKTARVADALEQIVSVESSCQRRRRGLPGLRAADHQFVRVSGWLYLPVFLVDNVVTSGATIAAARRVVGCGTGVVWADAA
jgi:predicted amidophosphoribosyltransferase